MSIRKRNRNVIVGVILNPIYIQDNPCYNRTMAYPTKFRELALQAVADGYTKAEINEMFSLATNTLRDWEKPREETGLLENRPLHRKPHKIDRDKLLAYYKDNPHSTDKETAAFFECSTSGIEHARKALGITRKKTRYAT